LPSPASHSEADPLTPVRPDNRPPPSTDTLHAEIGGTRAENPVLLLHGWGSNTGLMRPLAERLSPFCETHNVDLPGHGHSPLPAIPLDVPDHARLVADYIRSRMRGGPVTLVGHSNGGRIGLYMAAQPEYQPLFERLILISPSGITPLRGTRFRLKRLIARALRAPARILPHAAAEFFNDWITHSLAWRALGSSDYNALTGVMRDTFVKTVNFHVDDMVGQIKCPVLVLWGDRDSAVSLRQMQVLEERITDCGLIILDGAGHYGHLDALDTVAAACQAMITTGGTSRPVAGTPSANAL
jgi:pimeloyl-ACP methyl ester carboxylesterase